MLGHKMSFKQQRQTQREKHIVGERQRYVFIASQRETERQRESERQLQVRGRETERN